MRTIIERCFWFILAYAFMNVLKVLYKQTTIIEKRRNNKKKEIRMGKIDVHKQNEKERGATRERKNDSKCGRRLPYIELK